MAGESQQSSNLWLPSLIVAVVAGTGYLVHQAAYQSSRPAESGSWSRQLFVPEDVEARLWQDPLYAVSRHLISEGDHVGSERNSHHDGKALVDRIEELVGSMPEATGRKDAAARPAVTVLVVMVPRAPYSEAAERRRRVRYAVLSGLGRRAWVPEDQEHIHYFETETVKESLKASAIELPPFVPYEWLKPAPTLSSSRTVGTYSQRTDRPRRVLVLWLATEASTSCPVAGAATLLAAITRKVPVARRQEGMRLIVMGPPESGTLAELLVEALPGNRCRPSSAVAAAAIDAVVEQLSVYSPWASAADRELAFSVRDELAQAYDLASRKKTKAEPMWLRRCLPADDPRPPAGDAKDCDIEQIIRSRVKFVRLIADDRFVSQALLLELQRRGVDPACEAVRRQLSPEQEPVQCRSARLDRHRIAIVSEWDAPYQRSLRQTLSRAVAERCTTRFPQHRSECPRLWPSPWVVPFSYLRGVDGQLAETGAGKSSAAPAPKGDEASSALIERADGDGQFDYLRRLARRIERMDSEYENRGESGFGAIGVLGTDPYDKLTILQALREHFPDKIFFTTNLDARLLHPSQAPWARNLLVISAFDLRLEQCLQRDIPPLRDGYQTAAFFAVQVAVRDEKIDATQTAVARQHDRVAECAERGCEQGSETAWTRPWLFPLVFEVGRTGAFRLEPYSRDPDQGADEGPGACTASGQLVELQVHPPAPPLFPGVPERVRGALAISSGIIAALLVLAVPGQSSRRSRSSAGSHADSGDPSSGRSSAPWLRKLVTAAGAAAVVGFIGYRWDHLWTFLTESGRGEPAFFFEGISIWAGELVNLVCALLALFFVFRANRLLSRNLDEIRDEFPLCDGARTLQPANQGKVAKRSLSSWLVAQWQSGKTYLRICFGIRQRASDSADQPEAESSPAWDRYCREADTCPRFLRVLGWTLLYLTLAYCLQRAWPFTAPSRGPRSTEIDLWVTWSTVACFGLLLLYVFDALMICNRCIRRLVSEPPTWNDAIAQKFGLTPEIKQSFAKQWTAIQLIAKRTEAVGPLVYWPFLLLFLMILGRNPVLERWSVSESLIVIVLVSIGLVSYAALSLRRTTEAIRNAAIEELSHEALAAEGSDDKKTGAQLKVLIAALRELKRGAFAPYTEQHFIRALLLPLGGYAGSALLQYLTLVKP